MSSGEAQIMSLKARWAADPVASSEHIRRDVNRAVGILVEEGFKLDNQFLSAEVYKRSEEDGTTQTVTVMRGHMNGSMLFDDGKGGEPTIKMAWDYSREMRPNAVQRFVKKLGFGS